MMCSSSSMTVHFSLFSWRDTHPIVNEAKSCQSCEYQYNQHCQTLPCLAAENLISINLRQLLITTQVSHQSQLETASNRDNNLGYESSTNRLLVSILSFSTCHSYFILHVCFSRLLETSTSVLKGYFHLCRSPTILFTISMAVEITYDLYRSPYQLSIKNLPWHCWYYKRKKSTGKYDSNFRISYHDHCRRSAVSKLGKE